MGIGWDIFKANIGYNVADGVMNSISNAIANNAAEQEREAKIKKALSDKRDMLKTLVFMVGNNIDLDRDGKKMIAATLSSIYGENVSLFSIEDKIDAYYERIKSEDPKKFFSSISAINTDREQTCMMYVVVLLMYMALSEEAMALPVHAHNLSLIKKFFAIGRSELSKCYAALADKLEKDTDDVADVFEELTSEESIKAIEEANPLLVYKDKVEEEPPQPEIINEPETCDNPREEIERLYYEALKEAGAVGNDFRDHVYLADLNPYYVSKAVNLYAKDCVGEDALLVFDNTWTKCFKNGMLLTDKNIYIGNNGKLKVKISLKDVKFIDANTSECKIIINTSELMTNQIVTDGTVALANFLIKIIPLALKIEEENTSK